MKTKKGGGKAKDTTTSEATDMTTTASTFTSNHLLKSSHFNFAIDKEKNNLLLNNYMNTLEDDNE
jgi:hypothetical protein